MKTRIIGIGTANPPLRVSQKEVYDAYVSRIPLSEEARSLLEQVLLNNESIAYRYMAMEELEECSRETTQDHLIGRYRRYAVPVSVEAARKALDQAGITPEEIDAIVVNTCTGYLCPGITSHLSERLPLRHDVAPFDLQGMGCGGAVPGLETAYYYLQSHPSHNVLTVAVEMCSATIFFSEEPGVLISNCIFGDGAAATVLTNRSGDDGLLVRGFSSGVFPEYRDYLYYTTEDSKLKNVLSPRVPNVGAKCGKQVIDNLLAEHGLEYDEIARWVLHPGGERVIDAFQRALRLPGDSLAASRTVLLNFGNMSSATVLFVLEETLRSQCPQPGDLVMMCSFGAGFTAFACLLERL